MISQINSHIRTTKPSGERLECVDALRGFALIAIVILHSIEHYNLFAEIVWEPEWLKWPNHGTRISLTNYKCRF